MQEFLYSLLVFLVCLGGAYISVNVRNNNFPFYLTALSGTIITIVWVYIVKWSKTNIFLMSAYIDVAAALGYFIGLSVLGEPISLIQMIGIGFLCIGLFLVS